MVAIAPSGIVGAGGILAPGRGQLSSAVGVPAAAHRRPADAHRFRRAPTSYPAASKHRNRATARTAQDGKVVLGTSLGRVDMGMGAEHRPTYAWHSASSGRRSPVVAKPVDDPLV